MKRMTLWIGVSLLVTALIGLRTPAQAVVATDTVDCQKKIASETRIHYDSVYKAYQTCYESVLGSMGCDFATLVKHIIGAGQKLQNNIRSKCVGTKAGEELGTCSLNPLLRCATDSICTTGGAGQCIMGTCSVTTGQACGPNVACPGSEHCVSDGRFGVGLLKDLGFVPGRCAETTANLFTADTTETPGQLSFRELARCIASENLKAAGQSLIAAFGCTTSTLSFIPATSSAVTTGIGSQLTGHPTGSFDLCISALGGLYGKHVVIIPPDTFSIPSFALGGAVVCAHVLGAGVGQIACDGGIASRLDKGPNFCLTQDHDTTPADPGNEWTAATKVCKNPVSGPFDQQCTTATAATDCGAAAACTLTPKYGKADDSKCTNKSGIYSAACLESDCDGTSGASAGDGKENGICTGCNANGGSHNVCNSPVALVGSSDTCSGGLRHDQACCQDSDCWVAGDSDSLAAKCANPPLAGHSNGEIVVALSLGLDISSSGGCTNSDTYLSRGMPATTVFTTGFAQAGIADADASGKRIWKDSEDCFISPCPVAATGTPHSCIVAGSGAVTVNTTGLNLVTAAPLLDTYLGDAVAVQNFQGN